jgi:hypothetical protein
MGAVEAVMVMHQVPSSDGRKDPFVRLGRPAFDNFLEQLHQALLRYHATQDDLVVAAACHHALCHLIDCAQDI